ncbi:hypothetical protein GC176_23265 [bacterium]|nr:hypothetical protein [bacterium]
MRRERSSPSLSGYRVLLGLTALILLSGSLFAQDNNPNSPRPPETPTPATSAPVGAATQLDAGGAVGPKAETGTVWDRLIYLPYRNLKDAFDRHGSTVFLPYSEYLKRWHDTEPEAATIDGVITQSHYRGRVDQSLLRIDAELTVQVLGKPWVEIPVQFGAAAVGKLTAGDGQQVLLRGTGNGTYSLVFGEAGEHVVKLELAVPINTSPDGRSASFSVPPVGITTFELAIPEADQTVELTPQLVSLPVEAAAGGTRIKATLGSTTSIAANWHAKTGLKPDMELLAAVTNHQQVTLRDGLAHTDAWLDYDILRGEMASVAIAVPTSHRILGVSSGNAKIRGWKAVPGDGAQTLTIDFLNPVRDDITIEIHSEREFGTDPLPLAGRDDAGKYHGIHAIDAVRESGQISIAAANDLSLQFDKLTGLARIETSEVAERLRRDGTPTFKFYSSNIELIVTAKPVEPRLLVDSDYRFELTDDELKLLASLNYTVERAGVFELRVAIPEGLIVDGVSDNVGLYREHHLENGAQNVLRVVFGQKSAPSQQFTLQVRGHVAIEDKTDQLELTLPIPEPLDVEREVARVSIVASQGIDIITNQENVIAAQPAPIDGLAPNQQAVAQRSVVAWTFNRRPVEIPIRTERRPTRLTVRVGTTVNVKEELVEVKTLLTYDVQFAGLDTFRFAVPEAVSEKVQVMSLEGGGAPAIKQSVPAEEAVDGWITWTVTMQRPVSGSHRFQVSWDQTPDAPPEPAPGDAAAADGAVDDDAPATGSGGATDSQAATNRAIKLVFQTLRVLGLDGEGDQPEVALADVAGEVVVQKDRSLAVETKPLDEGLEAIDIRELQMLPQSGAVAYRYFRQPVGLKIDATKHELQKVVETVVTRGLVEVVTRRDTKANYRCRYRIRSSERQRLRVDVPVGSELLGVFVDGQPVNPERNSQPLESNEWDSYFVSVARPAASDAPFSLTLQMMTPIAEAAPFVETWGGRLLLRLPQIGGYDNSAVALQQLNTVIWVPEEFRLVDDAEGFTNETQMRLEWALNPDQNRWIGFDSLDIEEWIGVPRAGFIDFPTEGNRYRYSSLGGAPKIEVTFANHHNYTWLYSGALVVIAVLLRGLSWDTKLLLVLVAGFAVALCGLTAPGWTAEIVSTARFGVFALAGIWMLHLLFNWREHAEKSAPPPPTAAAPPNFQPAVAAVIPPPGVFDDLRNQFGE